MMTRATNLRTPNPRTLLRGLSLAGLLIAGVVLTLPTAGCYERTISVRGPGAARETVQQPYQEEYWIDRQIFGPRENIRP
jgi:hypothetical protein